MPFEDARTPHQAASAAAEELLRVLYGEDLTGCQLNLEQVISALEPAFQAQADRHETLHSLFEKGVETMKLLATPPPDAATFSPEELRSLLGERLDGVLTVSEKILTTSAAVREKLFEEEK